MALVNNVRYGSRGEPNRGGTNTQNNDNLLPEQQSEIERLQAELNEVLSYKAKVNSKLRDIQTLLRNFDDVVNGDIIVSVLPDENAPEILNSPIVTAETLKDFVDTDKLFVAFNATDKIYVKNNIDNIYADYVCTQLQTLSNELNDDEMYLEVLRIVLSSFKPLPRSEGDSIKQKLVYVLGSFESSLT